MQQVKVLVLGAGGSGKSELIKSLKSDKGTNDFDRRYLPSVGIEVTQIQKAETVFTFWDTAGDNRFDMTKDNHYLGTQLILATYDINDGNSYKIVERQINDVKEKLQVNDASPITVIFVATKCDNNQSMSAGLLLSSSKKRTGITEVWNKLLNCV